MPSSQKFANIVDLFEKSCAAFASNELFGLKKDGAWSWLTYGEINARVARARGGLATIGVNAGDRVAIISNNRVEWAVMAYATYGRGAAFIPMYEAQHAEEWEFILADCGAKVVAVANAKIAEKLATFRDKLPALEHVLCFDGDAPGATSYASLLAAGEKAPAPPASPAGSDVSNLIYTSGTTGKPKGVILTHDNIASNVSAVHELFPFTPSDRSLSFLPWAHSFGQTCELHALLSMGASMALNSALDKIVAEIGEVRPTILISVPRIFNRLYDVVHKQLQDRPAPIQTLFRKGIKLGARARAGGSLNPVEKVTLAVADALIFGKVRKRLGGRLKYAFSGGAALARDVAEFLDGIGILVYEGYGLTETSPITTANCPGARRVGSVGKAIPGVRLAIEAADGGEANRGEIVIYGPNVMKGYHHRDDENAAVLKSDGGFRTGDMGHVDDDGYLWITGRIKEQYKLENGKYVVPSPLEEELKLSAYITNVMVYGDNKPFNVALVVPDADNVKRFADAEGLHGGFEELVKHERVRRKIEEEIGRVSAHFRAFDRVKKIALIPEDFTTENDMLTPSLKLKRRNVIKKWGTLIDSLYQG